MNEEFELLRGEPIRHIPPVDEIPCSETSDATMLCEAPVVSVRMITYNHESFIGQAIESVVSQKTDFPFELIIGEDCSKDKTRDICFKYQKRYPTIIRVLWSEKNVGGAANDRRVASRCRSEFQAWCEGDDYWCDPFKLQKQVDVMRHNPTVGICVSCHREFSESAQKCYDIYGMDLKNHFIKGTDYLLWEVLRVCGEGGVCWKRRPFQTATLLVRSSCLIKAKQRFSELFNWQLRLNDTLHYLTLCSVSNMYYIGECLSVYRVSDIGISHREPDRMYIDAIILELKALSVLTGESYLNFWPYYKSKFFCYMLNVARVEGRREVVSRIKKSPELRYMVLDPQNWILLMVALVVPQNTWLYTRLVSFCEKFVFRSPSKENMKRMEMAIRRSV